MKITGIIAEYNPFHNGHEYHIQKTRLETGCDYVVVILSGDFTQRGIPAFINKHIRAKMALLCGADLVIELPTLYSCSSAPYFSLGGVSLLNSLNCIDYLSFGSEVGDINLLKEISYMISNENSDFQDIIKRELRTGNSFPKAFSNAFSELYCDKSEYINIISSPNNMLGIEYIKALDFLGSKIQPFTIKREGAAYLDDKLDSKKSSAQAIRTAIFQKGSLDITKEQLPHDIYALLTNSYQKIFPIELDDFSDLLLYKLINTKNNDYTNFLDINNSLSNKIKNNIDKYTTLSEFANLIKTREYTYARICRCLLHILLDIETQHLHSPNTNQIILPKYARILGFNKNSSKLLSEINDKTQIPLISKLSNATKLLDNDSLEMLNIDIHASNIYHIAPTNKYSAKYYNAYKENIIIL